MLFSQKIFQFYDIYIFIDLIITWNFIKNMEFY